MASVDPAPLQSEIAGPVLFQRVSTLGCKSSWGQASPSTPAVSLIASKLSISFVELHQCKVGTTSVKQCFLGRNNYKARGSGLSFPHGSAMSFSSVHTTVAFYFAYTQSPFISPSEIMHQVSPVSHLKMDDLSKLLASYPSM